MIVTPTSDDIAVALYAACKETGEPIGAFGPNGHGATQARHYALHALIHVFPRASKFKLCQLVGCPGKPQSFWSISWNMVNGRKRVSWFKDASYDRVIRAIEAGVTRRNVAPAKSVPARAAAPVAAAAPTRPIPPTTEAETSQIERIIAGRPVMDKGQFGGQRPRFEPTVPTSKADLYEELRKAAANTPARGE